MRCEYARMAGSPTRDPWQVTFYIAAGSLAVSLLVLLAVIVNVRADDAPRRVSAGEEEPPPLAAETTEAPLARLSYSGSLPPGLDGLGLEAAAPGNRGDIAFGTGEGALEVTHRYLVPVAPLGAGVDELTSAQLASILAGSVTDWADVGGVGGAIRFAAAGDAADLALQARFGGRTPAPGLLFATYAELRAAMTLDSGILAFMPLAEVRPSVMPIAVDGIDPVRGRGDLRAWPFAERISFRVVSERGRESEARLRMALEARPPAVTRVAATGDILQVRCALTAIRATGDWAAALRGPVAEYLAAADLTLASLDSSIQTLHPPNGCISTTNLSAPPETLAALTLAGIDGVTVATNHVFDCTEFCGNGAFLQTLENLAAANIKVVGGGLNLEAALAPAIFEVNGVRFGVLGFDDVAAEDFEAEAEEPGTAPLDDSYDDERASLPREPALFQSADKLHLTRMTDRIQLLKTQVDVVVVQIQSGTEDTHDPSPRSIKALRAAADAGADLVVGNQAHWVQAVEVRGEAFIAYALGNLIFDQRWTPEHTHGYLLEATFHGKELVAVRFVPYQIEDRYKPTFVTGATRAKIIRDVMDASAILPTGVAR